VTLPLLAYSTSVQTMCCVTPEVQVAHGRPAHAQVPWDALLSLVLQCGGLRSQKGQWKLKELGMVPACAGCGRLHSPKARWMQKELEIALVYVVHGRL